MRGFFMGCICGIEAAKQVAAYMEYDKWVPQQGLVIAKSK
jgi:hypothetical protein